MSDFDGADMTLEEVGQILRKSYETVSRMARAGKIPGAYQLAPRGRWAVRRRDFQQWHLQLGPHQPDPHVLPPRSAIAQSRRKTA